jgi:hypothetical protein
VTVTVTRSMRLSSLASIYRPIRPSQTIPIILRTSLHTMGAAGAQTVDTSKRLARLRELMNQKDNYVQTYVVPSEDQRTFCIFISISPLGDLNSFRFERISRAL